VLTEDSILRKGLRPVPGPGRLLPALDGAPLLAFSAGSDRATLLRLAEQLLTADGESWTEAVKTLKTEAGLDIETDVFAALSGEGAVALTLDEGSGLPTERLGLSASIGLADAKKAAYVLAKLASSKATKGELVRAGKGYRITPSRFRPLHVEVAGDQLVVSTDAGLAERIASGKAGKASTIVRPRGAWGAMTLPDRSASFVVDPRIGLWMFLGASSGSFVFDPAEGVAMSKKSKAKRRELEKVEAKIRAIEEKRRAGDFAHIEEGLGPWGTFVVSAAPGPRGLSVQGGHFLRAEGYGQAVEAVVRMSTKSFAATPPDPKLDELHTELSRLQDEFRKLREADRAAADKRKPK
jgi:hypothetical protein